MSKIEDDYPPTRGLRVRAIREAGKWEQDEFARLLTDCAKRKRIDAPEYDRTIVSKMENGRRDVSLTDAILAAALDPQHRSVEWIGGDAELKPLPSPRKRRTGNG